MCREKHIQYSLPKEGNEKKITFQHIKHVGGKVLRIFLL